MPLQEQARVAARMPHPRDGSAGLADAVGRAVARTTTAVAGAWERVADSAAAGDPEPRELIGILAGQEGGKQLRARLAIAAYLGMGGDDPAVCDALGAAVQLLHTGLCVHDDLIDGDDRRHGRPNVAGTVRSAWGAAGAAPDVATRQAHSAALLAGDLAISASLRAVAEAPVRPELRVELMREVLGALDAAIAGELLDVRSEQLAPEEARPIRMAELKTAGYSVILPLRLGAVASGAADATTLAALAEYGRHLGIAYQLKDDELAIFGDPGRTGKSTSSDVRGGKRTRLLQLALDAADPADRLVLDREVGQAEVTEAGVERVRAVMRRSGALERHRALIVGHAAEAVAALETTALPRGLDAYLQVIARSVPGRDR
ncbi:polyprenyl synthetase family protein [Agromyces sp. NPDC056523]|uniref:polyprenyl synthetase family protein n=1 Tax=Agromyces sp. NPDC056523 TaxID=3345850 RepID=UPI00366F8F56